VLHNNVGILDMTPLEDLDEERWDHFFAVNTKSMFVMCKASLPTMVAQGSGSIVNISTISSIRYTSPCLTYATSKAAVNQFTKMLAVLYGPKGIRANCILPGYLDTPLITNFLKRTLSPAEITANERRRAAVVPTRKVGTAWDVAKAAVFLASDDAAYINGIDLNVDGGMHCVALTTDTAAVARSAETGLN
jgi:NAD(P)-dependent dehydrogenase (short-subunit alcohol dehydrogenase family)